jgi:MFS family permease
VTPSRAVRTVLTSNAIEYLAFRFTQVVLPLVVLRHFDSAAMAGLVGGLAGLPVVTSPWWARRLRQRLSDGRGLALVSLWQAAAVLVVPVALVLGLMHPVVLAVAGLAVGVSNALASPGRTALLGDLGDRLGDGMATRVVTWDDAVRRAAMVVGPGLAGVGVQLGWTHVLLWVEGLALIGSALLVRRVVLAPEARAVDAHPHAAGAGTAPGILASVRHHPDILRGWVMRGTSCVLWFAFALGLAVQGERTGQSGTLYATALAAYGVGALAMTLVVAARPPSSNPVRVATVAWVGQGLAFVAMALWITPVPVAAWSAAAGAVTVVGIRAMTQVLLGQTSGPARRAALAGQSNLVDVTGSVGMLVGGAVIEELGVRPTLGAAGIVTAVVALVAGLRGRGRRRLVRTPGTGLPAMTWLPLVGQGRRTGPAPARPADERHSAVEEPSSA